MPVLHPGKVIEALEEKFKQSPNRKELLQLTASQVRKAGEPYTSVYLYMLHGDELVLEAFSGRETEHQKIRVGHGVCGTAVAEGRDQNVPDIDIDSDVLDPFSQEEESALKSVADALGRLL
ncbi:hypothetical protein R1sor_016258 [Riccia sorocarpa]|uniref:Uncharacterized protein n=1 Tax=Riccia sorocarpa TaxID=122646 RepID=A0ABD3HII2_9MARC